MREPGSFRVDVGSGKLQTATGRYVKTLKDLAGLYEDEAAYEALARDLGDRVAILARTSLQ